MTRQVKKQSGKPPRLRARHRTPPPSQSLSMRPHSGSLRLVAFSDYRVQDIGLLIEELSTLQPRPDLILYAGDDIGRFQSASGENLFEVIASRSRHGLCAVPGNDDKPSVRELIRGKSVFNVHLCPAVIGAYAVLGVEGAPYRRDLEKRGYISHSEQEIRKQLTAQEHKVKSKRLIILSHAPPEGVLDQSVRFSPDGRPRSIGSRALKKFLQSSNNVPLVVCGHAHRCGGRNETVGRTLIVNAANHDDEKAVGRFAVIDLASRGRVGVGWRVIRETRVLPGIGPSIGDRLREKGIRRLEELASLSPEDAEVIYPVLRNMGCKPEVICSRARAWVQNRPIVIAKPKFPQRPRVYLDIETDICQSYVWLVGCVVDDGEYTSFFAESPADEKRILKEFLSFIRHPPGAKILSFSGSRFDERILRQRVLSHGLDTSACDRMVDAYGLIVNVIALPTESLRLKELAAFFGYRYKHPDLDGWAVASLYEDRYQSLTNCALRRKLRRMLIEYNEDDVRCLPHILSAIQALERHPVND